MLCYVQALQLTQQLQKYSYDSSYKHLTKEFQPFYLFLQKSGNIYNQYHYHQRESYENNELAELADTLDQHQPASNTHKQNTHLPTTIRLKSPTLKIDF
ncbi:hypothetical protein D3C80_1552980 [compost metagenome]